MLHPRCLCISAGCQEQEGFLEREFPDAAQTQRSWLYVFAAQGSSGILDYWIQDGMKEQPEEVAAFTESLVDGLRMP